MNRAMCPLFMANCAERSDVARFRSSARQFPEASSLSAYCISERSWRFRFGFRFIVCGAFNIVNGV
ncbi:hypothetical protein HanPI659440_Chr08g0285531 [Helianthus annuus]|nr:hypothetical protein HanPI659440_Chr08g0285531 [Helianthus annuus]